MWELESSVTTLVSHCALWEAKSVTLVDVSFSATGVTKLGFKMDAFAVQQLQ